MKRLFFFLLSLLLFAAEAEAQATKYTIRADTIQISTGRLLIVSRTEGDTMQVDSLNVDTLVVVKDIIMGAGAKLVLSRINADTINVDSLTVDSKASFAGATISDLGTVTTGTIATLNVSTTLDMTTSGNRIDLDTDNDTSIRSGLDDTIFVEVGGTDRITVAGGNVGIGTTSPSRVVEIYHATQPELQFTAGTVGEAGGDGGLIYYGLGEGLVIRNQEATAGIKFQTNGANNRAIIDSVGNVGIGVTGPDDVLDVTQTSTTGSTVEAYRNLASGSTDAPVVNIHQDNASDDQGTLVVTQDGSGDILTLNDGGTEILAVADGGQIQYKTASVRMIHNKTISDATATGIFKFTCPGDGRVGVVVNYIVGPQSGGSSEAQEVGIVVVSAVSDGSSTDISSAITNTPTANASGGGRTVSVTWDLSVDDAANEVTVRCNADDSSNVGSIVFVSVEMIYNTAQSITLSAL